MVSGETPASSATAATVVPAYPRSTKSPNAASSTRPRVRWAWSARSGEWYLRRGALTSAIPIQYQLIDYSETVVDWEGVVAVDHLQIDGTEVDYQVEGEGERVMLLHSTAFELWYEPLGRELGEFSVLRYTRRPPRAESGGYAPLSLADDATTCVRLLDHLGWASAHAVGHSYGALLALQVARDVPARVASLTLLEPAIRDVPSAPEVLASLAPAIAAYRRGDAAAAVDGFLQSVAGGDYRTHLDRALPRALDTSIGRADLFFQAEMPVVQHWSFGPDDARDVTQPVLNVVGELSVPRFAEGADLVQSWFPDAELYVLPAAGHLLMVQNASDLAQRLSQFFSHAHAPAR